MDAEVDQRVIEAWREAADRLGIRVVAPYETGSMSFVAYLPDFGGERGMVVASLTTAAGLAESDARKAFSESARQPWQALSRGSLRLIR